MARANQKVAAKKKRKKNEEKVKRKESGGKLKGCIMVKKFAEVRTMCAGKPALWGWGRG